MKNQEFLNPKHMPSNQGAILKLEIRPMKEKKILFCTDFSRYSDGALALATSLAREKHATLSFFTSRNRRPPTPRESGTMVHWSPIGKRSNKC